MQSSATGTDELREIVRRLVAAGKFTEAHALLESRMRDDAENPHLMLIANFVCEREGRIATAYHIARNFTRMYPQDAAGWINLGRAYEQMYRIPESQSAYERALKVTKSDDIRAKTLNNLAAMCIQVGQFDRGAQYAQRALAIKESPQARANLGMAQLARHEWADGWANYAQNIGISNRHKWGYGADVWDGSHAENLVVYGEQGLGDEISAASVFMDAQRDCKRLILDCEPRLVGLYRRSFPNASVYGVDQTQKEILRRPEDAVPAPAIAAVQLGQHYRKATTDFPGTAYLKADPDRVTMWRALWDQKKSRRARPVIGVAWTGGIAQTGGKFRRWSLKDLLPVFNAQPDAHWVCLQYRDAADEIAEFRDEHPEVDIAQYPYATLTADYDDTAALVASLDGVFSMQTSVVHLAGALGVPTVCGVALSGQWRYGESGDRMPWYGSVRLFRQDKLGTWGLKGAARMIEDMLCQSPVESTRSPQSATSGEGPSSLRRAA